MNGMLDIAKLVGLRTQDAIIIHSGTNNLTSNININIVKVISKVFKEIRLLS